MIDLVVFSKDRPAQLDVLLGSIERFFVAWRDIALTVVHVATDDLAVLLAQGGRTHEAPALLETCLVVAPHDADARANLADIDGAVEVVA